MKKKLIFILALFFLLLILFNKTMMQLVFERKLSQWTEYNTELILSKFGLFSGQIKIQDIRLKNKLNFFNQNLFEASQIVIQIDSNTYFNELVVVKSVELKSPKFFFEIKNIKNKELKDNLNLIDKLSKKQKSKIYPPKKKDKNFVINNLNITDAKAFIRYEKYDKNVAVSLSDMSFSKVGNSGHFDPEFQHYKNVMKIILNDIYFRIPDENLRELIQEKYLKK